MLDLDTTMFDVSPFGFDLAVTQRPLLGFDAASLLAAGETIASAAARLHELPEHTDRATALLGTPMIAQAVASQQVDGTLLTRGSTYELLLTITTSLGAMWAMRQVLRVRA